MRRSSRAIRILGISKLVITPVTPSGAAAAAVEGKEQDALASCSFPSAPLRVTIQ
ncbi:hypothetical protein [Dyadobacter fanqingshengii]|uniref:Uncharacterized protein n=1 Tax=Dyadobacter fanqingshengii TaxID=2906443 RepID=A0A9X1PAL3_9BACT|nr:hypothetical protein [Dyadobacter fanqingshengii]MCF0041426.1 hypothetical protein [Dyadobacter fanqingshengii]USJ36853.1 hypothetical protein NFI81_03570 [Dyadobacter fanqingshengii]